MYNEKNGRFLPANSSNALGRKKPSLVKQLTPCERGPLFYWRRRNNTNITDSSHLPTVPPRCHRHDERVRAEGDTPRRGLRVADRVHLRTKKHQPIETQRTKKRKKKGVHKNTLSSSSFTRMPGLRSKEESGAVRRRYGSHRGVSDTSTTRVFAIYQIILGWKKA